MNSMERRSQGLWRRAEEQPLAALRFPFRSHNSFGDPPYFSINSYFVNFTLALSYYLLKMTEENTCALPLAIPIFEPEHPDSFFVLLEAMFQLRGEFTSTPPDNNSYGRLKRGVINRLSAPPETQLEQFFFANRTGRRFSVSDGRERVRWWEGTDNINVDMAKTGLRKRETSERASGMLMDLAGLAEEAIFGSLTDVLSYVLPNKTFSDQLRCSSNAWMRQTMEVVEIFQRSAFFHNVHLGPSI
nr:hypothetical transcript [Hymenolepis microstoma]